MPPVPPGHTHGKRVRFDLAQHRPRGCKHHFSEHKFAPLPYGRVYRGQSRSGRGRKWPRGIHPQPLPSRELQPDHNLHVSPTHRGDDSRFKTLLLNRIVKDLQPLNTATGYQDLARSLCPFSHIQLNDSWIQAELHSLYMQKREEIQTAVNAASDLVLSAELWSSVEAMSYLTVSCHLITENWIQKSYVIDTAHLLNERTPEHVLKQLLRISNEWNITEKIQVVVTNVDGMKKVHKSGWIFIPCFAHTLDKVFRETIGDSEWKNLVRKCQQIVAFFHQNNKASESLQRHCSNLRLQQTELIQIIDLKWLPTLHMLKSILALWPAIFKVFIDTLQEVSLNENERKILKDMVAVLNILKEVTEEMGSHEYKPISNIIPLVQMLQDELKKVVGNKIAQTLYEKCEHHTSNIKQHHWFRVSTALDPRYKTCVLLGSGIDVKTEIRSQMRGNTHAGHSSYDARNEDLVLEKYWQMRNVSENPLKFWSTKDEFTQLVPVARKYLTVVSTAIPMERVHKLEKSQIINRRSCLDPKNLNMILFLNAN